MRKPYRSFMKPSNLLVKTAVKKAGGTKELAALLGLSHQAVYKWGERVPKKRADQLAEIWGKKS